MITNLKNVPNALRKLRVLLMYALTAAMNLHGLLDAGLGGNSLILAKGLVFMDRLKDFPTLVSRGLNAEDLKDFGCEFTDGGEMRERA